MGIPSNCQPSFHKILQIFEALRTELCVEHLDRLLIV